jgi:GNAT superfamily N-acetyltransferase
VKHPPVAVHPLLDNDVERAIALVLRSFDDAVAPDYGPGGVDAFRRFATPDALRARIADGAIVRVAIVDREIVGVVEFTVGNAKQPAHVVILFVDPAHQRKTVGRSLLFHAIDACQQLDPPPLRMTVNSSPVAMPFYEKHFFQALSEPTNEDGMVATPMGIFLDQVAVWLN